MISTRSENSVYDLTKRATEESEARVTSLQSEIALLQEIIAQNRTFLDRFERGQRAAGGGGSLLLDGLGGSAKLLHPTGVQEARSMLSTRRPDDKRLRGGQTYAAAILDVLAKNPQGLTTSELTDHFRRVGHPISNREDAGKAVSNQLSQLRGKHLIVRGQDRRFTIVEN